MGTYKTQSRKTEGPLRLTSYTGGVPNPSIGSTSTLVSTECTQSTESYRTQRPQAPLLDQESFEWFGDVYRNPYTEPDPFDTGHEFYTTRTRLKVSHPRWRHKFYNSSTGTYAVWDGPLMPAIDDSTYPYGTFPAAPRMTASELSLYGGRAIKGTAPTRSPASLATFVGELFEGIPRIIGSELFRDRAEIARSAGSEYLNVVFGWKPLVSDIRKMAEQVRDHSRVVQQYQRDAGRLVRRRFHFDPIVTKSGKPDVRHRSGELYGNLNSRTAFLSPKENFQPVLFETKTVQRYWFSGAFTYHLNMDSTMLGKMQRFEQEANRLLGTRLTPAVLWELAPWSWLVDWFGTIGQQLDLLSLLSTDGLVLKYGYLMRETTSYNKYSIPSGVTFNGGAKTGPIFTQFSRVTKERRRATPYGFGLNIANLTGQQWAILGALGLTKAPRVLP